MNVDELAAYYNEHVLYEILMLRYAHNRLKTNDQMTWNAMFATFNVSARNIYNFLTNNESKNVGIKDFHRLCRTYTKPNLSKISGKLQKVNNQCFHMGKDRKNSSVGKIYSSDLDEVFNWIEAELSRLHGCFDISFKARLDLSRGDPAANTTVMSFGSISPSQSSHPTFLGSTGPTGLTGGIPASNLVIRIAKDGEE